MPAAAFKVAAETPRSACVQCLQRTYGGRGRSGRSQGARTEDDHGPGRRNGQGDFNEGRIALYGIYFDFNKADVKGESAPTLDQMAKLLKDNPSLKLLVVGHADNVGN